MTEIGWTFLKVQDQVRPSWLGVQASAGLNKTTTDHHRHPANQNQETYEIRSPGCFVTNKLGRNKPYYEQGRLQNYKNNLKKITFKKSKTLAISHIKRSYSSLNCTSKCRCRVCLGVTLFVKCIQTRLHSGQLG